MLEILNSISATDPVITAVRSYTSIITRSNASFGITSLAITVAGGIAGGTSALQYPAATVRELLDSTQSSTVTMGNLRYTGFCQVVNNMFSADGHNGGYNGVFRRISMINMTPTTLATPPGPARYAGILANIDNMNLFRGLGYTAASANTDTCARYNISANTWTPVNPAIYATRGSTAFGYGGKVYIFFGYTGTAGLGSCQIHDVAANTWSEGLAVDPERYPNGLFYNFGCLVGNTVWMFVPGSRGANTMAIIKFNLDTGVITYHSTPYPIRYSAGAMYNSATNEIYVVGGCGSPPGTANYDTLPRFSDLLVFKA